MCAHPIIECRGLSRRWRNRTALENVDLVVPKGAYIACTGVSGAGKSTLLRVLGTLDRQYTGRLSLFGQNVGMLTDRALSRLRSRRIAFVFQSHQLLPHLRVEENILLPWAYRRGELASDAQRERLQRLLEELGLAGRERDFPDALSGGQQQRVAIARALITRPELLLCDELTGNLDRKTADRVMDVMETYQRTHGATLLVVSHDPHVVSRAQRVCEMRDGRLLANARDGHATRDGGLE